MSSGTEAHVSSEGAEEENESRNPKSIKELRAETSEVRIMKQQRRVFLLYLWRTRPGCESFRVTLSSRNETPRLHVTHFLLKLEEPKLMRAQRGGEREREEAYFGDDRCWRKRRSLRVWVIFLPAVAAQGRPLRFFLFHVLKNIKTSWKEELES